MAIRYAINFSELDVFGSRDGDLVVTHDPLGDPELERALPRLRQVFELVRGRMGIYVELKGPGTGTAFGDMLHVLDLRGLNLIVGSFELTLVGEVRRAAPAIPCSILFGVDWRGRTQAMIDACLEHGARYAHPCFRPIDAELIDALHAADLRVMTPHTNDPTEARRFAEIGTDVIASDDPRVLLPLRTLTTA